MTSIWLRDDPGRPRRAPQLTRARIVAEAVTLLDTEGLEALTMRRLAQRLDVTSTALYWHVSTKDDVLDLAVDEIFGAVPLPSPGPDWRDDIRTLIHGWRAAMLTHPWAPTLIGRPMLGPNVLARTEFLQATLVRAGLSGEPLAVTTHLLANFVIGSAVTETAWPAPATHPTTGAHPAAGPHSAADTHPTAGTQPAADTRPTAGTDPAADTHPTVGPHPAANTHPAAGTHTATGAHPATDTHLGTGTHPTARARITADPAAYPTLTDSGHLDDTRWPADTLFTRGLETILATIPQPT